MHFIKIGKPYLFLYYLLDILTSHVKCSSEIQKIKSQGMK